MQTVLLVIIAAYSVITAFTFVTLPVEFDASKRALAWMTNKGIVTTAEHSMAKDALNTAAMSYVVVALSSAATLLYYVYSFLGINRD